MDQTRQSFKEHPRLWGIMTVAGLRGMASVAFLPFLALYLGLETQLGMSKPSLGLHISLLVGVGIVSTPIMGYLSDRVGRKLVLVPGMLGLAVLTALLVPFGEGIGLIVVIALLGIFLFSDQPILTAAALDVDWRRCSSQHPGGVFVLQIRSRGGIPTHSWDIVRLKWYRSYLFLHRRPVCRGHARPDDSADGSAAPFRRRRPPWARSWRSRPRSWR